MSKKAVPEYTLRIKMCDNGGFGFCVGSPVDKSFCITANMRRLLDGVQIKERIYHFLGSSSSQMKEQSATLYAMDEKGNTSEEIRQFSGNFTNSKNVSKYISQFGLLFSQSLSIFEIDCYVKEIHDIDGAYKPPSRFNAYKRELYCLSDGIGYMSKNVADVFFEKLIIDQNMDNGKGVYVPSAYQIRFQGYKGMLALNLNAEANGMFFRPSMKKFDSEDKNICLLKYSFPRATSTNRQLIMILDDAHKIPAVEFYKLYQKSVHPLGQASTSDDKAALFLRLQSQPVIKWDNIYNAKISILQEPFLRSMLLHSMLYRLRFDIKQKERLALSPTNARCAFGVVDETFTLQPGQIFFQATRMDEDKTVYAKECSVLTGSVMVFRSPCMQPGDVRTFQAVDVPALRHIKDCIVFPLNGTRSHADELAGGDYDGDEFVIIWKTELNIKTNYPAMDFPYGQAVQSDQSNFSEREMIQFYCKYFEKQSIGPTANKHLKVADYLNLQSKECAKLAFDYNIMLDSAKTGYFETDKAFITFIHEPDFMCNSLKQSQYLSKKILGQLFRQCILLEEMIKVSNSSINTGNRKANYGADKKLIKNRFTLDGKLLKMFLFLNL